jgi:hypothetical protein
MEGLEKLFVDSGVKEVELEFEGVKIPLQLRELSWSERNQLLSKCFVYDKDGQVQFNYDKYVKDCLAKVIVKAPWGETNQIFFSRIKPAFGLLLESLVPKSPVSNGKTDFFARPSGDSSTG